jgi:hypothetical protein
MQLSICEQTLCDLLGIRRIKAKAVGFLKFDNGVCFLPEADAKVSLCAGNLIGQLDEDSKSTRNGSERW